MQTFNLGDWVQHKTLRGIAGEVVDVLLKVQEPNGSIHTVSPTSLEPARKPLSPEEAWLECALHIGQRVQEYGMPLYEDEAKRVRHQCYKLLGSNKITVTEEVKVRVRSLIERAQQQQEKMEDDFWITRD